MKLQGSIKEIEDAKHQHLVKELVVKTISIRGCVIFEHTKVSRESKSRFIRDELIF